MKWLRKMKVKISELMSTKMDNTGQQETAAMVYGGDIYAVLLHDRAARQLARSENHRLNYHRGAGWPFIR